MAAKNEDRDHEDQHVAHVAFKIPDFWPHNPNTWFRKIESKLRICNIKHASTKYDHLLSALPRTSAAASTTPWRRSTRTLTTHTSS
jgi:hypothetical protein